MAFSAAYGVEGGAHASRQRFGVIPGSLLGHKAGSPSDQVERYLANGFERGQASYALGETLYLTPANMGAPFRAPDLHQRQPEAQPPPARSCRSYGPNKWCEPGSPADVSTASPMPGRLRFRWRATVAPRISSAVYAGILEYVPTLLARPAPSDRGFRGGGAGSVVRRSCPAALVGLAHR